MPDIELTILTSEQQRRALLSREQQSMLAIQDRINSRRRTLQQIIGERCGPPVKTDWRPR